MKVLMIGLGGIGQRHVRNIRRLMGDSVDIIAYRVRGLTHEITEKLTVNEQAHIESLLNIRSFSSLDDALNTHPDIAFVCNPSSFHIESATRAAKAGCHLFIEKPLSHSMDGIDELINIVKQKKLIAMVGFQLRFHPCYLKMREYILKKDIGMPLAVRAEVGEYMPGFHKYEDYRQIYAAKKKMGGGVVLTQIHEVDYLYSLFGLPESVYALGGHLSPLEIDVEDTACIVMRCRNNNSVLPVSLHMDYLQKPPVRTCTVIGECGKVEVDFVNLTVCHYDDEGKLSEKSDFHDFDRNQLFLDEISHFFESMEKQSQPLVTLEEGLFSLRVALAIKASLASGKPEYLN